MRQPRYVLGLLLFIGWMALALFEPDIAILLMAVPSIIFGLVGVARRRITTRGKVGPYRTHEGATAVFQGSFIALLGLTLGTFAAHNLWVRIGQHWAH